MPRLLPALLSTLCLALSSACVSIDYDLSTVPVPVSARPPAEDAAEVTPLRLEARHVLWVHGLAGEREPDVAAMVREAVEGHDGLASFRVRQETSIHHWLLTHLTLGFVRMRRVVVEGELVRDE